MSATAYIWRSRIAGYPILEGNMNEQREFAKKQQGVRKKERQLVITGDVAYPVTSAYRYIAPTLNITFAMAGRFDQHSSRRSPIPKRGGEVKTNPNLGAYCDIVPQQRLLRNGASEVN
ncbi:predicted protein [Aspergillus nidulans FGSC A4]|uniref:Uncharacterized protein n=1 Tax=Emericella nidulans (strain FGSC A4 / ATCC 38163 / CBS 112.46 / NRRL 194 / M139) TaxID=227321 RepID=Q5BFU6_EMENI|nr:hypothetical protein [Aspergillus nidulans FGSC A4]EAA66683.1 predicted protein [Aspergillus nidulans FGSC A4]CBF89184.1 TPA: conserved hypothetical protein [Aspergillus nidulans FGSC A4]|eukprot:XP_658188.1 predicted protein [Aspergillus nidulans FGSC A4]